jgi:aspartyl aminopeptidase
MVVAGMLFNLPEGRQNHSLYQYTFNRDPISRCPDLLPHLAKTQKSLALTCQGKDIVTVNAGIEIR